MNLPAKVEHNTGADIPFAHQVEVFALVQVGLADPRLQDRLFIHHRFASRSPDNPFGGQKLADEGGGTYPRSILGLKNRR